MLLTISLIICNIFWILTVYFINKRVDLTNERLDLINMSTLDRTIQVENDLKKSLSEFKNEN